MRIVTLLPSATEIVCALGLQGALVGRSHECDYPDGVADLPAVSLARIDSHALASAEIDAAVAGALERGEQLYAIDEATLARLRPDVVITQTLCRVCAVEGDGVRTALRARGLPAEVIELEPADVEGVLTTMVLLGDRLGAQAAAATVVADARARMEDVRASVERRSRPSVFVAEWTDPPFAAGHWVPEMVEIGGGREILGHPGQPSFRTSWDDVRARAPEVAIVAPCGYDLARSTSEAALVAAELPRARIAPVDANAHFSRPGPRVVDGIELVAAILHG